VSTDKILPYGKIKSVLELGELLRAHRKRQGITQADLAALSGVGVRFISDLENGKPSVELGRAITVAEAVGLEFHIRARSWGATAQADR